MSLIIGEPIAQAIGHALKKKQIVTLEPVSNGYFKVKPLGVFARFWHWNDKKFHEERVSKLASIIGKVISAQKRLSIVEAAEAPSFKLFVA